MSATVRWLTEADVAGLVDIPTAVAALQAMLPRDGHDGTTTVPKALATWDAAHSAHSLLATAPGVGLATMKNWVNVPGGASAVLSAFDTRTGQLRALVEAGVLGSVRTAATTGLAASLLAPTAAGDLAVVGAGRQALSQATAVLEICGPRRVHLWNRTTERARQLAARLRAEVPDVDVVVHDALGDAIAPARVIVTVTRATEPYLRSIDLVPPVLVVAVGAILPGNAELHRDVVDDATRIVVDDVDGARRSSRELAHLLADPVGSRRVEPLGRVVAEGPQPTVDGTTVVKPMGLGLSDLAVAGLVVGAAEEQDVGLRLPR